MIEGVVVIVCKDWDIVMRLCGCGEVEDIKLMRNMNIGSIFIDSETSKSYDSADVGGDNSEPSPKHQRRKNSDCREWQLSSKRRGGNRLVTKTQRFREKGEKKSLEAIISSKDKLIYIQNVW